MTYTIPDHIKGDTFNGVEFEMKLNGVVIDLTDCVILIQFKVNTYAKPVLILTNGSGLEINDPTNGKFKILPQIVDIEAARYIYDVQFTFITGVIKTYLSGSWSIINDITK